MILNDFLFYKINSVIKKLTSNSPEFISVMILCYLLIFNCVTIIGLISINNPEFTVYINRTVGIFIGIIIISLHFIYFMLGDKIEKINNKFQSTNKIWDIIGSILAIAYIVLSNWLCLFYIVPKLDNLF